ncbi:protein unc-93 homolog A [Caerostris extrusa]|uniref:Protein unc-93 homolog A n=1 Tax=Caerostris extrusa TaxID=172846 RepID=A0AAV4S1E3_CAEEX|nr:protein unc-93 homolog A [Caerostris extrusa]
MGTDDSIFYFDRLANSLYWAAQSAYLNQLSILYTDQLKSDASEKKCATQKKQQVKYKIANHVLMKLLEDHRSCWNPTTARFFGIHGLIYQTCHVWSNLMSYYVLRIGAVKEIDFKNATCKCGADFCTVDTDCSKNNLREPRDDLRNLLTGLFVALSVLSVLLVVFGLDELKKKKKNVTISWEYLIATCKHIKNKKQLFLIPMSLNIGVSQGFVMGDFTKDFVGCAWGVHNVGLVTTCLEPRFPVIQFLWLVRQVFRKEDHLSHCEGLEHRRDRHHASLKPDPSQSYMFFIISGILGAVLGTFWSQLRAFYGVLFKDKEGAAFANYQLWHAIGMAMAFAYSNYICTSMKIYIYIAFSTFGMIGYLLAERSHSLENK